MRKSILNSALLNILLVVSVTGCDSSAPTSTSNQASNSVQGIKNNGLQATKSGLRYQIHSVDKSLIPKSVEYKLDIIDDQGNVLKEFPTYSLPLEEMIKNKQFGLPVPVNNDAIYPVNDENGLFVEGLELIRQSGAGKYTLYLSYDNNIPPFSEPSKAIIPSNSKLRFNIVAK